MNQTKKMIDELIEKILDNNHCPESIFSMYSLQEKLYSEFGFSVSTREHEKVIIAPITRGDIEVLLPKKVKEYKQADKEAFLDEAISFIQDHFSSHDQVKWGVVDLALESTLKYFEDRKKIGELDSPPCKKPVLTVLCSE